MKNSLPPQQEKLEQLKQLLPEVFTEGKVDWEKLKLSLGEDINIKNERYILNWAGKGNAYKVLQEPTSKTLSPDKNESVDFDKTENLFIEGDNLEALKILQKSYFGKVKMIYIDPPYNTGNDSFIYPDRFKENLEDYQKNVGDKDEDGYLIQNSIFKKNRKENGQYHSNWLNMMMPRLYLAKNLLRDDGVIFISIDDNEVHNLRLLMNEIFGEGNFLLEFAWRKSDNQANIGKVARVKEYILFFAKNINLASVNKMQLTDKAKKEYRYQDDAGFFRRDILLHKTRGKHIYNINTPKGNILSGPWMVNEDDFQNMLDKNLIYWTKGGNEQPYGKIYLKDSDGQIPNDFLGIEFGSNQEASVEVKNLFQKRFFDFPKSVTLIKYLNVLGSNQDSIILDFFCRIGNDSACCDAIEC